MKKNKIAKKTITAEEFDRAFDRGDDMSEYFDFENPVERGGSEYLKEMKKTARGKKKQADSVKFYDPNKTFIELVAGYKGDMGDAFNMFQDGWSDGAESGVETRTFGQALGLPNYPDFARFVVPLLLKEYRRKSEAKKQQVPKEGKRRRATKK